METAPGNKPEEAEETSPCAGSQSAGFVDDFLGRRSNEVLAVLLADRTTGKNIIWADEEHAHRGAGFGPDDEMTVARVTGAHADAVLPRHAKERGRQTQRTKARAEVFTPSWLCNRMNNWLDAEWFGRADAFNVEAPEAEGGERGWKAQERAVPLPRAKGRGLHAYIERRVLEVACGEAPFLASRYDAATGEAIPVAERVGLLDRKLRLAGEHARSRGEWTRWALAALRATYGFECQGDNLLIARVNALETFCEHALVRWGAEPAEKDLMEAARIISWNLWQMDGLTGAVPTRAAGAEARPVLDDCPQASPAEQLSLFDLDEDSAAQEPPPTVPLCCLYDWDEDRPRTFAALKGEAMGKFFYAVIGNPPYHEEVEDNQRKTPIYNHFMNESFKVSEKTELITPARFLFNAGQTPKEWNKEMLSDPHLKVLLYEPDGNSIFPGPEIKGGIAVTYRDEESDFGAIEVYVPYPELKTVLAKIQNASADYLSSLVTGAVPYKFTDRVRRDYPELVEDIGKSFDLRTNVFDKLHGKLFFDNELADTNCIAIYGLLEGKRKYLWINTAYVDIPENFSGFKVLLPKASGDGDFGEKLGEMTIAAKYVGHTQTFISIGCFECEEDANALRKYLKTKFARALLGILKVTQDMTARVWSLVPLQDFTASSDIDWSQSVADIDRQLYAKYGLSPEEIAFIETHVKEMS